MKSKLIPLFLIAIVGVFALTYQVIGSDFYITIPADAPVIEEEGVSWAFDIHDKALLAANSTHIFIGTVQEVRGSWQDDLDLLYTDAVVHVLNPLKGDLTPQQMIVTQQGGYSKSKGAVLVLPGDKLFQPGETYIFYTSYNSDNGIHIVGAPTGKIQLETPAEIAEQLKQDALDDLEVSTATIQNLIEHPATKETIEVANSTQ